MTSFFICCEKEEDLEWARNENKPTTSTTTTLVSFQNCCNKLVFSVLHLTTMI